MLPTLRVTGVEHGSFHTPLLRKGVYKQHKELIKKLARLAKLTRGAHKAMRSSDGRSPFSQLASLRSAGPATTHVKGHDRHTCLRADSLTSSQRARQSAPVPRLDPKPSADLSCDGDARQQTQAVSLGRHAGFALAAAAPSGPWP